MFHAEDAEDFAESAGSAVFNPAGRLRELSPLERGAEERGGVCQPSFTMKMTYTPRPPTGRGTLLSRGEGRLDYLSTYLLSNLHSLVSNH